MPYVTQWLSPRRCRFDSGPVDVRIMVDKVALGETHSPCHYYSNNVPFHFFFSYYSFRRTSGRSLGTFQQSTSLSDVGKHWKNKQPTFALFVVSKVLRKY
jgi:hypothetical protein